MLSGQFTDCMAKIVVCGKQISAPRNGLIVSTIAIECNLKHWEKNINWIGDEGYLFTNVNVIPEKLENHTVYQP